MGVFMVRKEVSEEQIARMVDLAREGETIYSIADMLNCTYEQVRRSLQEQNVLTKRQQNLQIWAAIKELNPDPYTPQQLRAIINECLPRGRTAYLLDEGI